MMIDFTRTTILFGGTFDPVHLGHLHVAKYALGSIPGAQLAFVPAAQSPGKHAPVASGELRLRWLELATAGGPFQVWDQELKREGASYTVDTLMSAHSDGAKRDTLYWLLGADAYAGFSRWKEPGRIRSLARLLVVNRPGLEISLQDPSDQILAIPPYPASSTALRAFLANGGPADPNLPEPVAADWQKLVLAGQNPYASGKSRE